MPVPKNAALPEFYVYRLEVHGVPFYVGVGRAARASDRVRYVEYLMEREKRGKAVKWSLNCAVMAGLLRSGSKPKVAYAARDLRRADAVIAEKAEIARLLSAGFVLANVRHNPKPLQSAAEIAKSILARVAAVRPEPVAT